MGEFDLIGRYFAARRSIRNDVVLGIGDDAALVAVNPGDELVVAVDTLVQGVHFPDNAPAEAVGHKALAVNLSDIAAMGAEPVWATLAISLPDVDENWLKGFVEGFGALADRYQVDLIGGDTTRGGLTLSVQIGGRVPKGMAVRRSGARSGDRIGVTGTLGDAAAGLMQHFKGESGVLTERLHRPEPRVRAGQALRDVAHAMIDVSDGLVADLGHIIEASGVGADVKSAAIPRSDALRAYCSADESLRLALQGGDDYELCFTVAEHEVEKVEALFTTLDCGLSWIGEITEGAGLVIRDDAGDVMSARYQGYDHFQ